MEERELVGQRGRWLRFVQAKAVKKLSKCDPLGGYLVYHYEAIYRVTLPAFSTDRSTALIYVSSEDCLSQSEAAYRLRKSAGDWNVIERFLFYEQGE
ncbi:MAG TPA: hypothetical protein VHL58_14975 [Thermoanaerobaculia bacterium]|nr:hypothetical protein [Thermoanaerobaculia bacterium]